MASKYKVEILRDVCIGAATCVAAAPDAFELDNDNIAVLKDEWEKTSDEEILQAAESCPVQAIILKDKETGKQVFP